MSDVVGRAGADAGAGGSGLVLRLDAPAREWTDAFPVGDGRRGAMVHGGTARERLQVNDDTCWSGTPHEAPVAPLAGPDGPAPVLAAARRALADGDVLAAEQHLSRLQSGYTQANQPLVDLLLTQPSAGDGDPRAYRRTLDLADARATTAWTAADGADWRQDVVVSHPDGVLLLDRRTDAPAGADLAVALTSPHPWLRAPAAVPVPAPGGPDGTVAVVALVRMPARVLPDYVDDPHAVSYDGAGVLAAVALAVVPDAPDAPDPTDAPGDPVPTASVDDGTVRVAGARRVRVVLTTATDHVVADARLHGDPDRVVAEAVATLAAALADLDAVPARHVADHRALMGRVDLDLGAAPPDAPLDARLVAHARGAADPHLAVLAFQLGRYLTVAGSRPGTLPLHLQGIWNPHVQPPWNANYTININTEMNYWPTLVGDLAECHEPLLAWLDRLAAAGERTARELYGARGWVAHHNSDPWCFTAPVGAGRDSASWSSWPFGGVWLARHVVDHHDWTGDDAALRRHWPVVRGATLFLLDWLVPLPDGSLGTSPSTSPENQYLLPDGTVVSVGVSTTSDLAMAHDLLAHVRRLAPVAGDDDAALAAAVEAALDRLPAERVAPDGRLAEWSADVPDAEPEHRHQSHLYRVFPGTSIDPDQAPALAAAARRTLDARGADSTGWSLAWRLALRARLRDPGGVAGLVDAFLRPVDADLAAAVDADPAAAVDAGSADDRPAPRHAGGVYRSLLCAHPPFQVDGNLGFTAGVAEALVQAHRVGADGVREVHLLPALPDAWPDGHVRGLRLRGGVRLTELVWRAGRVVRAVLTADRPAVVRVRTGADVPGTPLTLPVAGPLTVA